MEPDSPSNGELKNKETKADSDNKETKADSDETKADSDETKAYSDETKTYSDETKAYSDNKESLSEKQITSPSPSAIPSESSSIKKKVEILLKATGDAPIMKTKKWAVESDRTVGSIIEFMKNYMKLNQGDNLFVYVNQSFAPSPDQTMLNLYDCFGSDGKLVLQYSKTPAWG